LLPFPLFLCVDKVGGGSLSSDTESVLFKTSEYFSLLTSGVIAAKYCFTYFNKQNTEFLIQVLREMFDVKSGAIWIIKIDFQFPSLKMKVEFYK